MLFPWQVLDRHRRHTRGALEDFVENNVQALPLAGSPRVFPLGRNTNVGTGFADLVAVEECGRLVLVETMVRE